MGYHLTATFVTSSADYRQCPEPAYPEYAFIGRSNVGKSSLINMITEKKMLAKISTTPGKTRLINHFLINDEWYLVDLPGYGYARIGQSMRKKWEKVIEDYLLRRNNLMSTFILVDARLPMQENDRQMISWFGENNLHFTIIFTKTDKLSSQQLSSSLIDYQTALMSFWEELPPIILTSSKTGLGREEIISFIVSTNRLFQH
ncbi:MAG: ribosome biogenesis GTP-binding protein YihA/YsxC [Bacteroidales bacterium]|nr:ribosome biogenesis GTP-binding protein YihA/YsxC [Bacteroidales bacterium]